MRNKTGVYYYLLYTAVVVIAYKLLLPEIVAAIIVAIMAVVSLKNFRNGIFLWCSTSYFLYTISTTFFAVSVGLLLIGLLPKVIAKLTPTVVMTLLAVIITIFISFSYGYQSQILPALLTLSNILIFVCLVLIYKTPKDYISLVDSFWYGSIILAGCTILSIISGGIDDGERLGFGDSVRTLANGMLFPLFFKTIDWIDGKNRSSLPSFLQNLFFVIFSTLLLLTLAKGAIFSLAISILLYAIINKKLNYKFTFAAVALVIVLVIIQIQGYIDFSRFGERNADLNGRTLIWDFYFDHLARKGSSGFWFGFGPGNVQRIAPTEYLGQYYAHSTVLDFFFSYGLIGFSLFIVFVVYLFKKCITIKNHIGMVFLILSLLTYSVTGASTNTQIFITFYVVLLSRTAQFVDIVVLTGHKKSN